MIYNTRMLNLSRLQFFFAEGKCQRHFQVYQYQGKQVLWHDAVKVLLAIPEMKLCTGMD